MKLRCHIALADVVVCFPPQFLSAENIECEVVQAGPAICMFLIGKS